VLSAVGAAAFGYVAGLLPSADLVARGLDPRRVGSGNPGAANVAGLLGKRAGATVFVMDMGKAVIAGSVGRSLAGAAGANIAASATVIGHCFPAHRGFRGGKGVAASFGQMLVTFPAYLPVDIALGAVAAKSDFWKQRPVATVTATCGLWTGLAYIWSQRELSNLWAPSAGASTPVGAAVSSAAIIYRFTVEANRPPPSPDSATDSESLSSPG